MLQPQTREQGLRDFLANNGFAVIEEEVVSSGKYLYVVMVAEYTGCCRSLSLMEKFCGKLTDNCTPQVCEKLRMTACHLAERSKGLFQEGEAALAADLSNLRRNPVADWKLLSLIAMQRRNLNVYGFANL